MSIGFRCTHSLWGLKHSQAPQNLNTAFFFLVSKKQLVSYRRKYKPYILPSSKRLLGTRLKSSLPPFFHGSFKTTTLWPYLIFSLIWTSFSRTSYKMALLEKILTAQRPAQFTYGQTFQHLNVDQFKVIVYINVCVFFLNEKN